MAEVSVDDDGVHASVGSNGTSNMPRSRNTEARHARTKSCRQKTQALAFVIGGASRFARKVEHPGSLIPERSYLRSSLDEMRGEISRRARGRRDRDLGARVSREAAFSALFAAVSAAYPWGLASRRMKLWGEVPASLRPAFFQLESGPETYQWTSPAAPRRTFEAKLFLYFDARDPTTPGASAINAALDAIDVALAPTGADFVSAARPSAAPRMIARSRACRSATPATSTATASRW